MTTRRLQRFLSAALFTSALAHGLHAGTPSDAPAGSHVLRIRRTEGAIRVDGDLSDPGWKDAAQIAEFFETNPGDNVPPKVGTTAWVTYDEKNFYVAIRCDDPDPSSIRAPYVDRDNVYSDQDFAGIMLDTRGDGRSALELFVNPRGIHDDGVINDANGNEDFSPDLFWDSAGRITESGWQVEMALPFASLRYTGSSPTWRLLVYRNRPREFRYQMFSRPLPRDNNSLLAQAALVEGLQGLPTGAHWVAAPYVSGQGDWKPEGGPGGPLSRRETDWDAGLDVKWMPSADHALDLTVNPDFSQVESDAAQISVNQRFALFYPEKRPFFMEGVDLLDTPLDAVYTRTITDPKWGVRSTGKIDGTEYTLLVAEDRGGGSVILPGPQYSTLAPQDFSSTAAVARIRRSLGRSFAGLLVTGRENEDGSYNRLLGPDFQWRPTDRDTLALQVLYSRTRTPDRPDLDALWDGREMSGTAAHFKWAREARNYYGVFRYEDVGAGFRADNGYVPRVGYRSARIDAGPIFYPKEGFFNKIVPDFVASAYWDRKGDLLERHLWPGLFVQGKRSLYGSIYFNRDAVRVGDVLLRRSVVYFEGSLSPSAFLARLSCHGTVGGQYDYANVRTGSGADVHLSATVRPTDHLTLQFDGARQWVDSERYGLKGRLFTAQTARLKALYILSSKAFLRAIVQYEDVRQDPRLHPYAVPRRSGALSSSVLYAYRLNWQTVLYVGAGDNQVLDPAGARLKAGRQVFFKVSYAFQR
ncbi:MAG: DUF5916 domain-containing protein [Acidobacteriota bacterium]